MVASTLRFGGLLWTLYTGRNDPTTSGTATQQSIEPEGIFMSREKLTGNQCQCTGCGEYFARVSTFDKHRTGQYEGGRRCLSIAEMHGKGWSLNAHGFWVRAPRPVSL